MSEPGVLPGYAGQTLPLFKQADNGLHLMVTPSPVERSVTLIWLVSSPWLESATRRAIVPTVIAQAFGGVAQFAPCTMAIRVASLTAYDRVLDVHMPRETSITERIVKIIGIPANANSANALPRRECLLI